MTQKTKTFDCVQMMRDIRDRLGIQMASMTHEERVRLIRSHQYSDRLLQRLIDRAVPGSDESD